MTKEILKQALEALESDNPYLRQLAANAIRNAFVQPVQEPVGYVYWSKGFAEGAIDVQTLKPGTPLYTSPAAQLKQDPVGEVIEIGDNGFKCEFNQLLAIGTKLYIAPPLLEQEPVVCRFCHSKKGCWTWQCYNCGEIDDVQKPNPPATKPEQEPSAWRDMIVASLVREGINKHKARELADHFAAQRPWQGMTEQDMPSGENPMFDHKYFCAGMVYAAKILKAKNT